MGVMLAAVYEFILEPWTQYFQDTLWIVLMGYWVTLSCGLVGVYLMLRKMVLVGDAISHSLLPGIAFAFIVTQSRSSFWMLLGAVISGMLTVVLVDLIHKRSRVKADAAIGIVFSALFALGVVMITAFAGHVDIDPDCVLYGQLEWVPLEGMVSVFGFPVAPPSVIRMAVVAIAVLTLIVTFYKELLVSTFDPGLAASLGIKPVYFHYGLTIVLSLVIVSAFESVGVVLVIGMLIFPGATAMLFSDKLVMILCFIIVISGFIAIGGMYLGTWLDCSIAAAMTTTAFLVFLLAWLFAPRRGLFSKLRRLSSN